MTRYEFRTVSPSKTIWTVEDYCRNEAEELDHAENANGFFETQVSKSDVRLARVIHLNFPRPISRLCARHRARFHRMSAGVPLPKANAPLPKFPRPRRACSRAL